MLWDEISGNSVCAHASWRSLCNKTGDFIITNSFVQQSKENVQQKCLNMDYCDNICDCPIAVLITCNHTSEVK